MLIFTRVFTDLEVKFLDKNDFDKGDLKKELENAGFESCDADNIADRVNDRKADNWTYDTGRQEALKEIQNYINSFNSAYENFRNTSATSRMTTSGTY